MSAPQLDASTSSEWIRTVAEAGAADKRRSPSQATITRSAADARRKRFVRLVTYTMVGLVGFTLLGVVSFAWRQHAMQSALAAPIPLPAPAALAAPAAPSPAPALAPTPTPEAAPAAAVAAVSPAAKAAAPKTAKKAVKRSPFLSTKPTTKTAKR